MPQAKSIDNFIDQHSDNKEIELCGKLAIIRTILEAEAKSSLFVDPSNIYNKMGFKEIENTWFTSFWKLLTENCSLSDLEERFKSVVFVIFNYDRCIEHYMYHSLPWQNTVNSIMYGGTPMVNQLLELVSKIKTFTEGTVEESNNVDAIRAHMMMSPRLVFLGFAFHKLNMKLLLPVPRADRQITQQRVFATAKNISFSDIQIISGKLVNYCAIALDNIHIESIACNRLFNDYSQSLEFE